MRYSDRIKELLSSRERRLFRTLNSPHKVQDYLDSLPINFELYEETYLSPRHVVREQTAHCFEGALFAAAVIAYHGFKPLLLDLKTTNEDEDHVVTLFQDGRYWGAISKTNHSILRWRDPVYRSVRELAVSYFHEYFLSESGKRTMVSYSHPFDLSRFNPEEWITSDGHLYWLAERLDNSPHVRVRPNFRARRASAIERANIEPTEWLPSGKLRKLRYK